MPKPIDEHYRDTAQRAWDQAEALEAQFSAVIEGIDDDGSDCNYRLCGVRTEPDGRLVMVFAEPGHPSQRKIVYVDAILALTDLIRREVTVAA